ncbi:MAG TPA: diacylglycerol kinase family protein [Vicinamibacterales bacterium]
MEVRRSRPLLGAEGEAALIPAPDWVAIVNPRSGGRARTDMLAERLQHAVARVLVSEGPGHADALVRSCRHAAGILVAGGDGTLFEVLQACDRTRQRIALAPTGRGNSLARDLGMTSPGDAIACVVRGVDRAIDLLDVTLASDDGTIWRGVSASNVAIGYPADVARRAAQWRRLGAASYALGAVTASPAPLSVRMRLDDGPETSTRMTGLVISNSRYVGPFLGFPSSSLVDGVFHTIEMRARTLGQTLHNVSALTGLGFYEPGTRRDLRAIAVTLDEPAVLKIDGEIRGGVREICVRIQPSAVTFRVPAAPHA